MMPHIGRRTGPVVTRSGPGEARLRDDCQQKTLASLVGTSWRETFRGRPSIVGGRGGFLGWGWRQAGSGMARSRTRAETNWLSQGQRRGQVQGELAGLAGDPSSEGKEASPKGLGGCHRLSQGDALGPAGQIVGHDLHRQPGFIGGKAPRGEMVQAYAVLEVPDGVLDLGVAAVAGLQFQGILPPGR